MPMTEDPYDLVIFQVNFLINSGVPYFTLFDEYQPIILLYKPYHAYCLK